ncbi:hypothetical protein LVJ94_12320 [Pendulispora rubella]|uniref:Kelch repeat-containing protein n=1 Tax=Pendulispora rubella TaxID=2741070 RepID=A0ABZ2LAT4_9BACT
MHRVTVTRGVVAAASLVLSALAACSLTASPGDYAQGGNKDAAAPRPPVPAGGARILLVGGQRKTVDGLDNEWAIKETIAGIIEADGTVGQFFYERVPPVETTDYVQATVDNGRLLVASLVRTRGTFDLTPPRLAFARVDTASGAIVNDWSTVDVGDASALKQSASVSLVRPTLLVASGGNLNIRGEDGGPPTTEFNANVFSASVDLENRKMGDWVPSSGPLSAARSGARSLVYKDFLYVVGGRNEAGVSDVVDVARLGADGKPGAFAATTKLPAPTLVPEVIAVAGKLVVVGGVGRDSHVTAKVFSAPINEADGTLGPWVEGPAMPEPLALGAPLLHKNKLYYFGGVAQKFDDAGGVIDQNPTDGISALDVAADGTLGAWSQAGKLPAPRGGLAAVVLP